MEISWIDIISVGLAIISFVYALFERSRRMPLWWTLKGLEMGTMAYQTLYEELRKNYRADTRQSIPRDEVVAHFDNARWNWKSRQESIKGIRESVSLKLKKEKRTSELEKIEP